MAEFKLCDACQHEYEDVLDRRFHAQPVACHQCGPAYQWKNESFETNDISSILDHAAEAIHQGEVLAIKGLGGYHLVCDAQKEPAVKKIRKIKGRDAKPLAVMFANIEEAHRYTYFHDTEIALLTSWRRPIVLVKAKKFLAPSVCNGLNTIGVVLPYMPCHHFIFEKLTIPAIVLTSGNIADEPIIINDEKAQQQFGEKVAGIISYNREIHNRTDDSVAQVINDKPRVLRRSRGYVPDPFRLKLYTEGILATGAELVNCFCLGKGNLAILSQHIGDLQNVATYEFYKESIERFSRLFRFHPSLIVHDTHPDYLSTHYAMETGVELMHVQHHHAHMATVMVEHGWEKEQAIGVCFDGTGLGDDGKIWGGEFLTGGLAEYERKGHFDYQMLPGGDKAVKEPWRNALGWLYKLYGKDWERYTSDELNQAMGSEKTGMLIQSLSKGHLHPLTSSCGRLFDAVAALTGICTYSRFHAQAPMLLESILPEKAFYRKDYEYPYNISAEGIVSFDFMMLEIVNNIKKEKEPGEVSWRFHNTLVSVVLDMTKRISDETGLKKVTLSGGSFQNKYLLRFTELELEKLGFEVASGQQVPVNDGGLALGQLAVAAMRRINHKGHEGIHKGHSL